MKMIVGLGNPGIEYNNTRHNIGFMVIDSYAKEYHIDKFREKFNGMYAKVFRNGEYFILLKPLSFMNLSGNVVKRFASFYKIKPEDIFIIQDDMDLPIGKIKVKFKGSSGGHNGIKNIIDNLKTEIFPRLKVGISKDDKLDAKDYVLGKFSQNDLTIIDKIFSFAPRIIDDFLDYDIERVMSKYNGEEYEVN